MTNEEVRARYRNSPEWLMVELVNRIAMLEEKVEKLKRKPGRPKKVNDGAE